MDLTDIPGVKLAYLAATVAASIAQEIKLEDLNILASFVSAVGDNLAIIAAQRQASEKDDSGK